MHCSLPHTLEQGWKGLVLKELWISRLKPSERTAAVRFWGWGGSVLLYILSPVFFGSTVVETSTCHLVGANDKTSAHPSELYGKCCFFSLKKSQFRPGHEGRCMENHLGLPGHLHLPGVSPPHLFPVTLIKNYISPLKNLPVKSAPLKATKAESLHRPS